MYTVYKFKENGNWIAMAVRGDDTPQVAHMAKINAQVIDKTVYDFGPDVAHVAPHNTELNDAGEIIRFIAPYAYTHSGQRTDVFTLAQHDACPVDAVIVDPLDDIKDQKKDEIQEEKKRVRDGGVMVGGVLFDTDMAARVAYQEFAMMLGLDPAYTVEKWRASPGQFVVMDGTRFQLLMQAAGVLYTNVYAWQEAQEKNVDEALTGAEVAVVAVVYNE